MMRTNVDAEVEGLIGHGNLTASTSGSASASVQTTIVGDGPPDLDLTRDHADDPEVEQLTSCDVFGEAGLLWRPADPTAGGACEALFVRSGDTRDVIATKDRRWQVSLEKGEVMLRWMGDLTDTVSTRPVVYLKNDGSVRVEGMKVVIDASDVRLGGDAASAYVALANLVKDRLDTIQSLFNAHTHTGGTISGNTGAPQVAQQMPTFASVAASRVKATS